MTNTQMPSRGSTSCSVAQASARLLAKDKTRVQNGVRSFLGNTSELALAGFSLQVATCLEQAEWDDLAAQGPQAPPFTPLCTIFKSRGFEPAGVETQALSYGVRKLGCLLLGGVSSVLPSLLTAQ